MLPMVTLGRVTSVLYSDLEEGFKALLNSFRLDEIGNYIKGDPIILMIGVRSYESLKRKKDKVSETKRTVRARMRLVGRLYLTFKQIKDSRQEVQLRINRTAASPSESTITNQSNNVASRSESTITNESNAGDAGDIYRRDAIPILSNAINTLCDKDDDEELQHLNLTGQKSGLKVGILNTLKKTANLLVGYYLMKRKDEEAREVMDFLKVFKYYEDEIFGSAYYDINHKKNVEARKPKNLANNDDVDMVYEECYSIIESIDEFTFVGETEFVLVRTATTTALTMFNARRGGEPVRLRKYQWPEALNGDRLDKGDEPSDHDMLLSYQTGKGSDHLVPVFYPEETWKGVKFLTDDNIRRQAGVSKKNHYIFSSTRGSDVYVSGWHCMNEILTRLSMKGMINPTRNRHRVASLMAKLELSEKEKEMIFKHFGHSKSINENVYQACPGSTQLKTTGKILKNLKEGKTGMVHLVMLPEKTGVNPEFSRFYGPLSVRPFPGRES